MGTRPSLRHDGSRCPRLAVFKAWTARTLISFRASGRKVKIPTLAAWVQRRLRLWGRRQGWGTLGFVLAEGCAFVGLCDFWIDRILLTPIWVGEII